MKLTKSDIGRWIRVRYTDVGVRDVLVVDYSKDGKYETVQIFEPYTGLTDLNTDVIAKGELINPPIF